MQAVLNGQNPAAARDLFGYHGKKIWSSWISKNLYQNTLVTTYGEIDYFFLLFLGQQMLERWAWMGFINSLPCNMAFVPTTPPYSAFYLLYTKIAQGIYQRRLPLRTLTQTIDLTKAFDMVNHTKLIRVLTLSSLSNNTKCWLSACLKGRSASYRYNFILSPSSCISPTLFNSFVFTFPSPTTFSPTPM